MGVEHRPKPMGEHCLIRIEFQHEGDDGYAGAAIRTEYEDSGIPGRNQLLGWCLYYALRHQCESEWWVVHHLAEALNMVELEERDFDYIKDDEKELVLGVLDAARKLHDYRDKKWNHPKPKEPTNGK